MRKPILFLWLLVCTISSWSQQSLIIKDPYAYQRFIDARQWFATEDFKLAYPVFKELYRAVTPDMEISQQLYVEELKFYNLACELSENNPSAEPAAKAFMESTAATVTKGQLGYYLGSYYFRQQAFEKAIEAFNQTAVGNLNNDQIAAFQFQHGYSFFTQKQFTQAKPLFNSVRQSPSSPYYWDANYYYGLLAFNEKNYKEALKAFSVVENDKKYASLVPYYSAGINYSLGQKDKAMQQATAALQQGNTLYKNELLQLLGHGYFEKGDYTNAKKYLQQYVDDAAKVTREDLYELAYCYYINQQYTQAIEQFKPLAGGDDSLSQHAMYLLGDAYLKTNQKGNARSAFLFCSTNSSQQMYKAISLFNYGKLSYELGFDNDALMALKQYINSNAGSANITEAKDLLVAVLANTSNYKEALDLYESLPSKSEISKRQFPRIAFNRAQELLNDRNTDAGEKLLQQALAAPYNEAVVSLAHFWLGEIDFAKGRYSSAVQHFEAYLAKPLQAGEANQTNGRYNLGYSLLRLEEYKQAANVFNQLKSGPFANVQHQLDVILRLADCYFMLKDFSKAIPLYNDVAAKRGFGADYALFQSGMILGAQNKPAEKISALRSIGNLYPGSSWVGSANMEIADTYLADEKFKEAIPYLENIMNGKGQQGLQPAAYLKAGLAQYNLGNNSVAITLFTRLIKQYPQSAESEQAIDNVRSIYVEMGKPDAYVAFLKEVGKKVDVNVADSISYVAAEMQLGEGRKTEALASFKNYLAKFPEGRYAIDANFYAAELLKDNKQWPEALPLYEAVAGKAPNKYAERSMIQAARLHYFDAKNYVKATKYYQQLKGYASTTENKLEAMRGLVRSQYYESDFSNAIVNATELLQQGAAGSDDKIFANLVLAKQAKLAGNCNEAIRYFKEVAVLSKAEFGAASRYQIASCLFEQSKYADAEKAAFEVIQKSGSYEEWVTRSYILLGDIFMKQKDYFNAKATFKSVAENAAIPELKKEAEIKLAQAEAASAAASKIIGGQ